MTGSLAVLDLTQPRDGRGMGGERPYARAGFFAEVRIEQGKKVIG